MSFGLLLGVDVRVLFERDFETLLDEVVGKPAVIREQEVVGQIVVAGIHGFEVAFLETGDRTLLNKR